MSFNEADRQSVDLKPVETFKDSFCKHAGCSWEETVKEVPEYADLKVPKKFKVIRGKW